MPYNDDQLKQIQQILDAQKASAKAQLDAQKQQSLQDYNTQRQQGLQQYVTDANNVDIANAQNAKKLNELMAASGGYNSGANVTANLNLANQRQQGLNTVATNKNNFLQNLQNQINNTNRTYDANINSLNNDYEAKRLTAIQQLQQQQHQEELAAQQAAAKARAVSYNTALSSSSGNDGDAMAWDELRRVMANSNGDYYTAIHWLMSNRDSLQSTMSKEQYNLMLDSMQTLHKQMQQDPTLKKTYAW